MTPTDHTPLEPDELRVIVDAWGGVDRFATLIHVKPRTVESWLRAERGIKPPVAMLIRQLGLLANKKSRDKPGPNYVKTLKRKNS